MVLKESDHLRKVRCKIKSNLIEEGLVYYCKKTSDYFIFQNIRDGSTPERWIDIKRKYVYKYSWVCQKKGRTLKDLGITHLTFLNKKSNIYELWA